MSNTTSVDMKTIPPEKVATLYEQLNDEGRKHFTTELKTQLERQNKGIDFNESSPTSMFFYEEMKDHFMTARHMINIVTEASKHETSDFEQLSKESVFHTLKHSLILLMEADKKLDLMYDELRLLLNPELEPTDKYEYSPDSKGKHWLS